MRVIAPSALLLLLTSFLANSAEFAVLADRGNFQTNYIVVEAPDIQTVIAQYAIEGYSGNVQTVGENQLVYLSARYTITAQFIQISTLGYMQNPCDSCDGATDPTDPNDPNPSDLSSSVYDPTFVTQAQIQEIFQFFFTMPLIIYLVAWGYQTVINFATDK